MIYFRFHNRHLLCFHGECAFLLLYGTTRAKYFGTNMFSLLYGPTRAYALGSGVFSLRKDTRLSKSAPISPIPRGLSVSPCVYVCVCVCLCVCVSACVRIVRTDHTLAKIKHVKMTFVDFDICHRKASLRKLYSVTLTLTYFFKVKKNKF